MTLKKAIRTVSCQYPLVEGVRQLSSHDIYISFLSALSTLVYISHTVSNWRQSEFMIMPNISN